jgi:hypothetical protein
MSRLPVLVPLAPIVQVYLAERVALGELSRDTARYMRRVMREDGEMSQDQYAETERPFDPTDTGPIDPDALERLRVYLAVTKAVSKLGNKFGVLPVLEQTRAWVEYMDRQIATMNAHFDGSSDG